MQNKKKHIVWVLANHSTAPYFNWFAEKANMEGGIKLTYICLYPEKPQMIEDMERYGCVCHWIQYNSRNRKLGLLKASFNLFKLLKKLKPDVVHSHLFDDSLATLFAAKFSNIKKRFITKGDTGFHYFYTPKWVIFDKLNNLLATHIIAISSECRKFILEKENAKDNKVHIIHHGLPVNEVTLQIEQTKNTLLQNWDLKNKIVIGTIARFIEWKGYKDIIAAAEILIPKYPDIVFLLTGNGDYKKEIKEIVTEKNISANIIFTDWVEPEQIPSLYGIMNIYLHAARYEPFGLVIAEAMLNAVPVVSTNTGAAADAIEHKKSGYLCNYSNPVELANGIEFVLNNNNENVIGKSGKEKAIQQYSIDLMYKKHIELYYS